MAPFSSEVRQHNDDTRFVNGVRKCPSNLRGEEYASHFMSVVVAFSMNNWQGFIQAKELSAIEFEVRIFFFSENGQHFSDILQHAICNMAGFIRREQKLGYPQDF